MRPWKRWLCRCGWHSESYRHKSDRTDAQANLHHRQCQTARDHGIVQEETDVELRQRIADLERLAESHFNDFTEAADELATALAERDEARALLDEARWKGGRTLDEEWCGRVHELMGLHDEGMSDGQG